MDICSTLNFQFLRAGMHGLVGLTFSLSLCLTPSFIPLWYLLLFSFFLVCMLLSIKATTCKKKNLISLEPSTRVLKSKQAQAFTSSNQTHLQWVIFKEIPSSPASLSANFFAANTSK